MRYPDPWPDFLAKYAQFETLNAHSNLKKYNWRGKRRLDAQFKRRRGGQPGNRNAFKNGAFGREQLVTWAMFRAFLRAMDAEMPPQAAKKRPRSATRERL